MRSLFRFIALGSALLAGAACTCDGRVPCSDARECQSGICVDGFCEMRRGPGEPCESGGDCTSGSCTNGICDAGRGVGAGCEQEDQCGSRVCEHGACQGAIVLVGQPCTTGGSCASGICINGRCGQGQRTPGSSCNQGAECTSGICMRSTCVVDVCQQIDLVIAVDNSSSMQEEKATLRERVFPALARTLKTFGELDEFRIGVTDACPSPAQFHTFGASGACNFQGGHLWMRSQSTALESEFMCVGDMAAPATSGCSTGDDDEQPVSSAALALEDTSSAGNPEFLRENALLVVMGITDEDEQPVAVPSSAPAPPSAPEAIFSRLTAIKGRNAKRIVFAGMGGSHECDGPFGLAAQASRLRAVTHLFAQHDRGVFWDLCEGDLDRDLYKLATKIQSACGEFLRTGGAGAPCSSPAQCLSGQCNAGQCTGASGGRANGAECTRHHDCASHVCIAKKCEPPLF